MNSHIIPQGAVFVKSFVQDNREQLSYTGQAEAWAMGSVERRAGGEIAVGEGRPVVCGPGRMTFVGAVSAGPGQAEACATGRQGEGGWRRSGR